MPSKTKSQLIAENAALRARLAELEDKSADRPSGNGGELPESEIAERKRIQDAMKVSEVRYRRLFETAKDGILILEADTGRITDANPFLRDLLGYSHTELLGRRLWEIGPFKDIAASRQAFRNFRGRSISVTTICRWKPKGAGVSMWSSSATSTGRTARK